tara:strand:+ start:141 stop:638 length:498 start_codon:yes stop_codon:yes gene_type:complete
MATLKLSKLSVSGDRQDALDAGYLYKDLDLGHNMNRVSYNNQLQTKEEIKDVQGIFDLESIKNSILNIFLTAPGEKILNPTFGIDLKRFVFEPMDNLNTLIIRSLIQEELPNQEPRINLLDVKIIPDIDNQQYLINIIYDVRSLQIYGVTQEAVLNSSGYTTTTE